MSNKLWPIKSDTSCLLKWGWSTVWLDKGKSLSCHRCRPNDFTLEEFDFHNTPGQIADREKMLAGEWPGDGTGCEYCRDVEQSGGLSDRQFQLKQLADPGLVPPELQDDPTATRVTPTMLEVWFRNTCNMSCVYCYPEFSSQIETEYKKFGNPFKKVGITEIYSGDSITKLSADAYHEMKEKLWKYLATDDNYKKLRRYHILGGEPFLLQELDESIEFFERHPNPNLVFSLITNLNSPPKVIEKYVDRFQKLATNGNIWKLQITGSLDCWNSEQEYVRWGLDLKRWEENFKMFAEKEWTIMSINSVLSALTLSGLPALMEKIIEWNRLIPHSEKILWSSNVDVGTTSPLWFGPGYFEQYFDEADKIINDSESDIRLALKGLRSRITARSKDTQKIQQLQDYLTELDLRRKTNWREIFPWLDKSF